MQIITLAAAVISLIVPEQRSTRQLSEASGGASGFRCRGHGEAFRSWVKEACQAKIKADPNKDISWRLCLEIDLVIKLSRILGKQPDLNNIGKVLA